MKRIFFPSLYESGKTYPVEIECEPGQVSDGYHTFDELYEHRFLLFLALIKARAGVPAYISKVNHDGSSWEGWFVLWTLTPAGQISYHLPMKYWDIAAYWATEKPRCDDYDGHTSQDVVDRLNLWLQRSILNERGEDGN